MKEIKRLVARISGHRNHAFYGSFCYAVEVAARHQPEEPTMKVILAEVQTMQKVPQSAGALNKSLSRAADDIWEYGDRTELCRIFERELIDRPTPRELVLRLGEHIWRQESQIVYTAWKNHSGSGYGIVATRGYPAYRAVTTPMFQDAEELNALLERMNREQMPLELFEECYLYNVKRR